MYKGVGSSTAGEKKTAVLRNNYRDLRSATSRFRLSPSDSTGCAAELFSSWAVPSWRPYDVFQASREAEARSRDKPRAALAGIYVRLLALVGQMTKSGQTPAMAEGDHQPQLVWLEGQRWPLQPTQSSSAYTARSVVFGQAMSIKWLWQEESRFEKVFSQKSLTSPDFGHMPINQGLWIEGCSNSPGVKTELAAIKECCALSGDESNGGGAQVQDFNWMAGLNQGKLSIVQQTGGRGSTPNMTSAVEGGPREGVVKNSSGTCGDIWTLCKAGQLEEALHILYHGGIQADSCTYGCVLQACIDMKDIAQGRQVHAHIIQSEFKPDIFLFNTLVNMYAKCGTVVDARGVFDKMPERDIFTWNTMIAGYTKHGCAAEAFKIYEQMQREGASPDRVTFVCMLNACASLGNLKKGKQVHTDIIKGLIRTHIILETALIDMYAKCGSMKDARQLFDKMTTRNVVSWNAMITGYGQHGCCKEALELYEQMQQGGVTPNRVTFICVLNACASLGALEKGKEVHIDLIKAGIASYVNLDNTLVDMYAKCGSMKDARRVFANMLERDAVSWNAMIAGCAQHGCGREALQLVEEMQQKGWRPNSITFKSLLSACSHVGLVEEACHYFELMIQDHGLTPTVGHFSCIVDLLGRAGRLDEAQDFINKMPIQPDPGVWRSLLGACRLYGHVKLAECAANALLREIPNTSSGIEHVWPGCQVG